MTPDRGSPDGAADPERRAHQGDSAADPLRRQLVAHHRDADRDQRRREALQAPGDDQPEQGVAHRPQQRAGEEHQQRDHDHESLAVHVSEPRQDGRGDGAREQGDRDEPRGVVRRRAQQAREVRQQRHDQRLHERHRRAAQGQHQHDQPGATRPLRLHRGRRGRHGHQQDRPSTPMPATLVSAVHRAAGAVDPLRSRSPARPGRGRAGSTLRRPSRWSARSSDQRVRLMPAEASGSGGKGSGRSRTIRSAGALGRLARRAGRAGPRPRSGSRRRRGR